MLETILNMNYDVTLKDLGYDSLDVVQTVIEIEDKYKVLVTDEQMMSFKTCGDVQKYILNLKN